MKYGDKFNCINEFYAWQPSTWPLPPKTYSDNFGKVLKKIFHDSLLSEIDNVIKDAPTIEHRGHVIALSILCAIDALSSYVFQDMGIDRCQNCGRTDQVGPRYEKYIREFFPLGYRPFAKKIYKLYRNSITHSWNLFEAGMLPGNQPITENNGSIVLGLLNFFDALNQSVANFLEKLEVDNNLQNNVLTRYSELKQKARP